MVAEIFKQKLTIPEKPLSFNDVLNKVDALKHQFGSDPTAYSPEIREMFIMVANEILEVLNGIELNVKK